MTFSSDCKLLTFGFNIQLKNKYVTFIFFIFHVYIPCRFEVKLRPSGWAKCPLLHDF